MLSTYGTARSLCSPGRSPASLQLPQSRILNPSYRVNMASRSLTSATTSSLVMRPISGTRGLLIKSPRPHRVVEEGTSLVGGRCCAPVHPTSLCRFPMSAALE
jgi:hypothetical protein